MTDDQKTEKRGKSKSSDKSTKSTTAASSGFTKREIKVIDVDESGKEIPPKKEAKKSRRPKSTTTHSDASEYKLMTSAPLESDDDLYKRYAKLTNKRPCNR